MDMKSAKSLFQATPVFKDYAGLLNNPAFETARHAALSSFSESLPQTSADPSKAWDSYLQIVGARRALEILGTLHEPDEESKPTKFPTLNYDASKSKTRQ